MPRINISSPSRLLTSPSRLRIDVSSWSHLWTCSSKPQIGAKFCPIMACLLRKRGWCVPSSFTDIACKPSMFGEDDIYASWIIMDCHRHKSNSLIAKKPMVCHHLLSCVLLCFGFDWFILISSKVTSPLLGSAIVPVLRNQPKRIWVCISHESTWTHYMRTSCVCVLMGTKLFSHESWQPFE